MSISNGRASEKPSRPRFAEANGAAGATHGTNGKNPGAVRAELNAILERFDAADQRLRQAATHPDRELAEAERREAMGDHHALTFALADLCMLLLRYALQHRQDALRQHLAELLRPELTPLADALADLERRRA